MAALLDRAIHHSHLIDFTNCDFRQLHDAMQKQKAKVAKSVLIYLGIPFAAGFITRQEF